MKATTIIANALCSALLAATVDAQRGLPKRDVVDVPAVSDGLCLHNLFQSDMVLQRGRPIEIRGWATPGETVTVTLADEAREATAGDDRRWSVSLSARPASAEPLSMTVRGREQSLTLDNILMGDVWVLGGQSNMEFPLERTDNGWLEIVSARFDSIRILTVPAPPGPDVHESFPRLHEWSDWFGRHFRKGDWDVCSPEIARDLSAIGYVFARRLHMATRVPIGVIDMSRGGTSVETWIPASVLASVDTAEVRGMLADWEQKVAGWDATADLERRQRAYERRVKARKKSGQPVPTDWKMPEDLKPGPAVDMNRPATCFKGMLTPLAGLPVKGAIFHQGYNNAKGGTPGAALYRQLFGRMIHSWREAFGDRQMPFGIISLCTDGPWQTTDNYSEMMCNDGMYIREAQYQTFLDLVEGGDANVGFASSFDQRRSWYHPQQKIPVGERIARWALATQYGMAGKIKWKPPVCTSMDVVDGTIVLHMDRDVSAEDTKAAIEGFAIAGLDRCFHPATAEWLVKGEDARGRLQHDRSVLVLTSVHVPEPLHFRYAWGRNPMGNLQSADHNGLPFATQRSDSWPIEDVPLGVLGEGVLVDGAMPKGRKLSRRQWESIRTVLRKQDLDRRLAEARALLETHGGR